MYFKQALEYKKTKKNVWSSKTSFISFKNSIKNFLNISEIYLLINMWESVTIISYLKDLKIMKDFWIGITDEQSNQILRVSNM